MLFKSSTNFVSLSLKDLLEARDQFHYHLMNKKNVVATAVGLYPHPKGRAEATAWCQGRSAAQAGHPPHPLQF
jgi:hypothetical protein